MASKIYRYEFDVTLVSGEENIEKLVTELCIQKLDRLVGYDSIIDYVNNGIL